MIRSRILSRSFLKTPFAAFSAQFNPGKAEDAEDIFAKMRRDMELLKDATGDKTGSFVSSQKDDVIYIKNPADHWKFGRVLSMNGGAQSALILSL